MVVVPVICNAIQYWVTDSFIKKKKQKKQAEAPQKELPPPPIRGNPNESIDLTPYNSTPVNPIEEGKKSDKSLLLDHEDWLKIKDNKYHHQVSVFFLVLLDRLRAQFAFQIAKWKEQKHKHSHSHCKYNIHILLWRGR